jgi:hypothetical protein
MQRREVRGVHDGDLQVGTLALQRDHERVAQKLLGQ